MPDLQDLGCIALIIKADKAESKLSEKGHDINRKTVNRFYEENKELYRSVQRAQAKYLAKDPRELSPGLALGQLFLEYKNNKTMSLKMLGEIARYVKMGCPVSKLFWPKINKLNGYYIVF